MPFQLFKYNNKYTKKTENPNEIIKKNFSTVNTVRESDCNTPFRMPLNLYRKTSSCDNCITNEKILKDNVAMSFIGDPKLCYEPYITRKQNLNGDIDTSFIYNSFNILYRDRKTYVQNTQSNFYSESPIAGTEGDYYNTPEDLNNNKVLVCSRSTKKFTNYLNQANGGSSHRNRIQRLKQNTILGAQSTNSVNRTLISIQGMNGSVGKQYRNYKKTNLDVLKKYNTCYPKRN